MSFNAIPPCVQRIAKTLKTPIHNRFQEYLFPNNPEFTNPKTIQCEPKSHLLETKTLEIEPTTELTKSQQIKLKLLKTMLNKNPKFASPDLGPQHRASSRTARITNCTTAPIESPHSSYKIQNLSNFEVRNSKQNRRDQRVRRIEFGEHSRREKKNRIAEKGSTMKRENYA